MRGKPLVLERTEEGCIVPTSHKLNQDGYFRYTDKNPNGGRGRHIMYHRFVWEKVYGNIPKGYEVDHMCRNRACCNIKHLQLLSRTDHLVKTNKERYADRHKNAYEFWKKTKCTGVALGEKFGVSFSNACRWIRNWKV